MPLPLTSDVNVPVHGVQKVLLGYVEVEVGGRGGGVRIVAPAPGTETRVADPDPV